MSFADLSENSRLWVFSSTEPLDGVAQEKLRAGMDSFIGTWSAHKEPIRGAYQLLYDQFLIVVADSEQTAISGCGIDALFRAVRECSSLEISSHVFFRAADKVCSLEVEQFAEAAEKGRFSADTIVFNNALTTLAEFRAGRWETTYLNSWHAKRFPLC